MRIGFRIADLRYRRELRVCGVDHWWRGLLACSCFLQRLGYRWLCHANLGRANLGRANLDANNVAAAISELENAVRQMPASASAHFFLAEAYRRAGREADAEREKAEFEKTKVQQDSPGVPALQPFGIPEKN
jgi:tetratricopeptide (TPR) repeat protein